MKILTVLLFCLFLVGCKCGGTYCNERDVQAVETVPPGDSGNQAVVPEPTTLALVGMGLVGMVIKKRG